MSVHLMSVQIWSDKVGVKFMYTKFQVPINFWFLTNCYFVMMLIQELKLAVIKESEQSTCSKKRLRNMWTTPYDNIIYPEIFISVHGIDPTREIFNNWETFILARLKFLNFQWLSACGFAIATDMDTSRNDKRRRC